MSDKSGDKLDRKLVLSTLALLLVISLASAEIIYYDPEGNPIDDSRLDDISGIQEDTNKLEILVLETKAQVIEMKGNLSDSLSKIEIGLAKRNEEMLKITEASLSQKIEEETTAMKYVPPIIGFFIATICVVAFIWAGTKAKSKLIKNGLEADLEKAKNEVAALTMQLELTSAEIEGKKKKAESSQIRFMSAKELDGWNKKHLKRAPSTKKVGIVHRVISKMPFIGKKKGGSNGLRQDEHDKCEAKSNTDGHVSHAPVAIEARPPGAGWGSGQIRQAVLGEGEAHGEAVSPAPSSQAQPERPNGRHDKRADGPLSGLSKKKLREMKKEELIELLYSLEE